MNILVCFKTVFDTDQLVQEEWVEAMEHNMDFQMYRKQLNCYDETALELGLRMRNKYEDEEVTLTGLTIGENDNDIIYKNLFAVGYDRICCLLPDLDITYTPLATAKIIQRFIEENEEFDLIIFGQQTGGGDYGQTHWMLSELLDRTCVTQVRDVQALENEAEIWTVEDAEFTYLRIATLREKMKIKGKKVEIQPVEVKDNVCIPNMIWREDHQRKCNMIEGESTKERVEILCQEVLWEVLE